MPATSLELRIHVQGGPVETFVQTDPAAAARILEGLHSHEVVQRQQDYDCWRVFTNGFQSSDDHPY